MTKLSPHKSLRSQSKWQNHVDAQIASGLSQAAYCRQQGISGGSFSAWKQKLNPANTQTHPSGPELPLPAVPQKPVVIPVILKREQGHTAKPASTAESTLGDIRLKATLPNGIVLEFTLLSANMLTSVLSPLGQWSC